LGRVSAWWTETITRSAEAASLAAMDLNWLVRSSVNSHSSLVILQSRLRHLESVWQNSSVRAPVAESSCTAETAKRFDFCQSGHTRNLDSVVSINGNCAYAPNRLLEMTRGSSGICWPRIKGTSPDVSVAEDGLHPGDLTRGPRDQNAPVQKEKAHSSFEPCALSKENKLPRFSSGGVHSRPTNPGDSRDLDLGGSAHWRIN